MRKHQSSFGRKRSHAEFQFSQDSKESQPDLTQSDPTKDSSQPLSQESQNSQANSSQGDEIQDKSIVGLLAAPSNLLVRYEEGLPQLLYEEFLSDREEDVVQAGEEIFKRLEDSKSKSSKSLTDFIGMGGHAVVLMILRKWRENAKIQAKGCSILASLIHHWQNATNLSASINIVEHLNKMGAMEPPSWLL